MSTGIASVPSTQEAWLTRARARMIVLAVSLLLAAPYAASGGGWFREDFWSLRNARVLGVWSAAGPTVTTNRPIAALVYSFVFGVIGDRPLVAYLLLTALGAAALLLLLGLLEHHLGLGIALAATIVYALMPNRSAMTHWVSTAHIWVALIALLAALLAVSNRRPWWWAALLLVVGVLSYTAIAPVALAFLAVDAATARPRRWRQHAPIAAALLIATAYGYVTTNRSTTAFIRAGDVLSSNFGWGLTTLDPLWQVVQVVVLVGIALALVPLVRPVSQQPERAPGDRRPALLVAVGLGIVVLGIVPFATTGDDIDFVAQGDRANFISGIGAALVLTGIGLLASRAVRTSARRVAAVVLVLVLAAGAVGTRLEQDRAWADTARAARSAVDRGVAASQTDRIIDVAPCPISRGGVEGINNDSDATMAVEAATGSTVVVVRCRPAPP